MSRSPATRFPLRVRGGPADAADWDALADALRTELLDVGATRVERVSVEPAPADARGVVSDIVGALNLFVTATQTVDSLARIVRAVQQWMASRPSRVTLEVDGIELDSDESTLGRIVDRLLGRASQQDAGSEVGARRALVIANLRYDDAALRGLRAPADDARALDRVLGDPDIGRFDVDLCVDESEPAIRRRIADFFADRDRDDLLLLHYSGHGVKDSRGRLFLAARDTDLRRLSATAIPASFLNDQMTESASRRVVLVLDCCYSGAFARGALVRADRAVHVAEEFGGQGRVVLTASSATEYAFEGGQLLESEGTPSVFTSALVHGLETGAADLDTDGEITIDELYDYTYREVRQAQPGQAPMKWSFGVEGSLVLARSVRGAELPHTILADLRSNRIGLRLEAVDELQVLLDGGKPGVRAAARRALDQLRDHDDSNRVRTAAAHALATAPETPAAPTPAAETPAGPTPASAATAETRPAPTPVSPPAVPAPSPAPEPRPAAPKPVPAVSPAPAQPKQVPLAQPKQVPPRAREEATVTAPEPARAGDRTPLLARSREVWPPRTRNARLVAGGIALLLIATATTAIVMSRTGDKGSAGSDGGASAAPTVLSVAFSPDGKTLATGHETGQPQVRLWNLATGQPAAGQPLTGHLRAVYTLAFSPDGKTLASGGEDNTARLWNVATGQPAGTLVHPYGVRSVAFSPDGKTLASGSEDTEVRLWNVTTGQPARQPLTGHTGAVYAVAFSPDGKTLASGSSDDTVRLWNAASGQPIGQPLTGHTDYVTAVAFSPDSKTLASGSSDHTARLWNAATGQPIGQPLTGHTETVTAVAFSPDGKTVASAGRDGAVKLWNPVTGLSVGQLLSPGPGYSHAITSVAFSPDGKTFAAGRGNGTVQLWNPATGQAVGTLPPSTSPSVVPSPTPS